ncbi:hypothetical protein Ancab_034253 [Ancistrocladus abbreviatus]
MSIKKRQMVKQELESLKMEDISSFMESLSHDFLTILRTKKLGALGHVKLLAYANYAVYGLSEGSKSESGILEFASLDGRGQTFIDQKLHKFTCCSLKFNFFLLQALKWGWPHMGIYGR